MISEDDLEELKEEDRRDLMGTEESCDRVLKSLFNNE